MALYLVQHGKSLPKEQDPEQGLAPEGRADVGTHRRRGTGLWREGSHHSTQWQEASVADCGALCRSVETGAGVEARSGMNPLDDAALIAGDLRSATDLMLVGHLPFMERLTSYLIIGSVEKLVFKFQNGGIVCLDQDQDARLWFIKWSLMPKIA